MRLPLVPERPFLAPLKSLASATTAQVIEPSGRLILTIEHDPLRGVTPQMLRWWFEHIGGDMEHGGATYPKYLLWHPRDHIHWALARAAPNGGSGQGAHFRIVEAFATNPAFYVDSVEYVEKLDDEGIALVKRIMGIEIFRLEHRFGTCAAGATYHSRMAVGLASGPLAFVFNRWIRPRVFSDAMGTAWMTHNIEEVGLLEQLLPKLYPAEKSGALQATSIQ